MTAPPPDPGPKPHYRLKPVARVFATTVERLQDHGHKYTLLAVHTQRVRWYTELGLIFKQHPDKFWFVHKHLDVPMVCLGSFDAAVMYARLRD